jgi:integrase
MPIIGRPTKVIDSADSSRGRVCVASKKAGRNGERPSGALVHGLRHTFATELANAHVSVYTLMKLQGHESMVISQRY